MWLRGSNGEEKFVFFSSLRAPDPFFLEGPWLLINLPKNELSYQPLHISLISQYHASIFLPSVHLTGFPGGSEDKASACTAGDLGDPGSGRSPGEGNVNPLQFFAWKIPWMEEPGRLQPIGSQRVGHDWKTSLPRSFVHFTSFFQDSSCKWYHVSSSLWLILLSMIPSKFIHFVADDRSFFIYNFVWIIYLLFTHPIQKIETFFPYLGYCE